LIGDLLAGPVDDDLLRCMRRRIMDRPDHAAAKLIAQRQIFGTLAAYFLEVLNAFDARG